MLRTYFIETGQSVRRFHFLLKWAFLFFVIALIAAAFGFSSIAAGAAGIAKILF